MNPEFKRFESVVTDYFHDFSTLAKIMGKSHNIFYSYKNRAKFGKKMLFDLEQVGINPRYITKGELPKIINFDYITKNKNQAIEEWNKHKTKVNEPALPTHINISEDLINRITNITLYNYTAQASMGGIQTINDLPVTSMPLSVGIKLNPKTDEAIYVHGESMQDAGLHSGDIVVFNREKSPATGNWVLCLLNGHLILKEYIENNNGVILRSKNGKNKDITIGELEDFRILGVVKTIIKELPF